MYKEIINPGYPGSSGNIVTCPDFSVFVGIKKIAFGQMLALLISSYGIYTSY